MSWPVVAQVVLSGLSAGVAYAVVAAGITVVAGLRGSVPLAQGDLAGGSSGLSLLLVLGATPLATDPGAGSSVLELAAALVLGCLGGAALFLLASRWSGIQAAVAALALGALVRDGLTHAFARGVVSVGDPLHLDQLAGGRDGALSLGDGVTVASRVPGVILVGLALLAAVAILLRRSRFGRGVEALSQDPDLAAMSGVDARRASLAAYAFAGFLAAAGGLLVLPGSGLTADTGALVGLSGFLAATAGGFGSLPGAVLAGLGVGVGEAVVAHAAPSAARPAVLGCLVLVALLRPTGAPWAPAAAG